jgi:hypothetical protein
MSRLWRPAGLLAQRARMHSGRALVVDHGRLATGMSLQGRPSAPDSVPARACTAGETDRSVSPEERLPGVAVGAPDAESPLTLAGPGQETLLRRRVRPDPRALEQPLPARPATHDARVIGVPRSSSGEPVGARVVSVGRPALTARKRHRFPTDATAAGAISDPPPSSTPSRTPGDGR